MFNYFFTLLFLGLSLAYYTQVSDWHIGFLNRMLSLPTGGGALYFSVFDVYVWVVIAYALVLPIYYRSVGAKSKAWMVVSAFLRCVKGGGSFSAAELQAARVLLLKFFFAPLMVSWLAQHLSGFAELNFYAVSFPDSALGWLDFYNKKIHSNIVHFVVFIDVFFFTVGYLIEHHWLRNEFVSVDPTLSGWLACVICYPPFNGGLIAFLGWQTADSPVVEYVGIQFILNLAILISFTVYSAASWSLGFKASNLTNRGIVERGVYRWLRHPAYAFKNMAWWLGAMPALWLAVQHSPIDVIAILLSLCGWTTVYVARALTEERHLLMTDNGYREYMQRVRYRFIPGLI